MYKLVVHMDKKYWKLSIWTSIRLSIWTKTQVIHMDNSAPLTSLLSQGRVKRCVLVKRAFCEKGKMARERSNATVNILHIGININFT